MFRYRLRTLLIVLTLGPPVMAAIYLHPGPTFSFLVIVGSAVFAVVMWSYESWKAATAPLRKRLDELEVEIAKSKQGRPT